MIQIRLMHAAVPALLIAQIAAFPTARAGEVPLYQPPPPWVQVADVNAVAKAASGQQIIFDVQERIEGSTVTTYLDTAVRLDTPQALTQAGTLGASWMPDKGDLVIHRAELVRDGQSIDLLKGDRFQILRREQQLEMRVINGQLTATMPVSGARVGDVLRLSYSVSDTDPALKGQVQSLALLPAGTHTGGFGRIRASWRDGRAIRVSAGPRTSLPAPIKAGGFDTVSLDLPLPKPPDMPDDAPPRYRLPTLLQASSFSGWEEVSRTMAPLYATEGAITKDGPIAGEVAQIAATSTDAKVRMAAAVRLVQDRISYFDNGMNGGNYVPQAPKKTWEVRYGDCKAKALLLLALLRAMDITAEPLLVSSGAGDRVPDMLPMPGAFDHIIVHAKLDGKDYWLDGTSAGTRPASLSDVPPFRFGLPLTAAGSGLVELPLQAPAVPMMRMVVHRNDTAGIDFPELFDIHFITSGPAAAMLQPLAAAPASKERDDAIDSFVNRFLRDAGITARTITADPDNGNVTIAVSGMDISGWQRNARPPELTPKLPSTDVNFAPDRGRVAWRDIPVWTGAPMRLRTELTIDLPDAGRGATLEGTSFHGTVAGNAIDRDAKLAGSQLIVTEDDAASGSEIAVAEIPAERARLTALGNTAVKVKAAPDTRRIWDVRTAADRRRLKPIEDAYAQLIAAKPEEASSYVGRASFLDGIGDYMGAEADLTKAITLDADASWYQQRGGVHKKAGAFDLAIADLKKAQELEPSPERLAALARLLGRNGQPQAGIALVDPVIDGAGQARPTLIVTRSELLAELGRKQDGAAALESLLGERPSDPTVLNAICWYGAVWNFEIEKAFPRCDRAVETADWAPQVLDSRAFALLRLAKYQSALDDANAALTRAPGQVQTLLLRGIIRKHMGDAAGATDITEALRRQPGLAREYRAYGVID